MSISTVQIFGATTRGPRHRQEAKPNQDAWLRAQRVYGHLIVVCDGLGSRATSEVGAHAGCSAVLRAVSLWPGTASGAAPLHLTRLVEILWRLSLGTRPPDDCATTCMFAIRERDGHLVLAGIGDGLAVLRKSNRTVVTYGGRGSADYGNETLALGVPHRIDDWWIATEAPGSGRVVVLASDGVADDLDPNRLDGFVDYLNTDVGRLSGLARWRSLHRELTNWPVPYHVDDKTVAVLAEPEEVTA